VAFKRCWLEGLEVVFIVVGFGRAPRIAGLFSARPLPSASCCSWLAVHRPLSRVPENLIKHGVGCCSPPSACFLARRGPERVRCPTAHPVAGPAGDVALPVILLPGSLARGDDHLCSRRVRRAGYLRALRGFGLTPSLCFFFFFFSPVLFTLFSPPLPTGLSLFFPPRPPFCFFIYSWC